MDIAELVRSFGETIGATATVKSVFGEPVTAGQRAVLPVATIKCSFGGGGGTGGAKRGGEEPKREGGGGGGGGRVVARPCGLVDVTPEGARFVYYQEPALVAAAVAAGFLLGFAFGLARRSPGRESDSTSV
jgi:uncharacterized spore protein YtfJ